MGAILSPNRLSIFLLIPSLLLAACVPMTTPIQPTPSQPTTRAATPTPPPTSILTNTPTLQPTPTSTPSPKAFHFIATTFDQPGAWVLRYPYSDPQAPKLIEPSAGGFRLRPDFQVASIELTYRWVGIGDTVRAYQRIEQRGDGYWREDTQIPPTDVANLVQSIAHLIAEPDSLSVTTHSDDYPSWAVELTSLAGDKILLYSNSNSSSFIPWNVIYNGEIYAQFDGTISSALSSLFEVVEGQTIASVYGPQEEGYLQATTIEGPPQQVSVGFNGLMPLNKAISYVVDAQKGELSGYLSDEGWTSQVGGSEINWLSDIRSIEIDVSGKPVACTLENVPQEYPDWLYWRFNCPVGKPGDEIAYRFPIRMTFSTSTGSLHTISGELFGYWQDEVTLPLLPYPEEIGEILKTSPLSADLLSDHLMKVERFYSLTDVTSGLMTHRWEASVGLLGQVQVGMRLIPYTLMVDQVKIADGKLVQWHLDRSELEALLKDVLAQPITQHFLESDPDGMINLYYGESDEYPLIKPEDLPACAYLPQGKTLPTSEQPLRGFSFNHPVLGSGFYSMQIVFMDDSLRIYDLNLRPSSADDEFWMSLLPAEFKPVDAPAFTRIDAMSRGPAINAMWSADTSPAEESYYNAMFSGWEVNPLTYDPGLKLTGKWFDLTPEGELVLLDCQAP